MGLISGGLIQKGHLSRDLKKIRYEGILAGELKVSGQKKESKDRPWNEDMPEILEKWQVGPGSGSGVSERVGGETKAMMRSTRKSDYVGSYSHWQKLWFYSEGNRSQWQCEQRNATAWLPFYQQPSDYVLKIDWFGQGRSVRRHGGNGLLLLFLDGVFCQFVLSLCVH